MMIFLRLSFCLITLFLVGCSTNNQCVDPSCNGPVTPVVQPHAARGYNKPYQIKGVWYYPKKHYEHEEVGIASYYGGTDVFHGRPTSTGETFDMNRISAAHKELPLPCVVRVTNLKNGRSVKVKVNDRGPFVQGRVIDVSRKTAQVLGFYQAGTAPVKVETLVAESIHLAKNYRKALYRSPGRMKPALEEQGYHYAAWEKAQKKKRRRRGDAVRLASYQIPSAEKNQRAFKKALTHPSQVFVQAGIFPHTAKARSMANLLRKKNLKSPVKIYRVRKKEKAFYKVLIGPFKSSREANFLVNKMRKHGYQQASVTIL